MRPGQIGSEIDTPQIGKGVLETDEGVDNEALAAVEATLTRLNKLGVTIRQSPGDRIDMKVKRFAANLDLGQFDAASWATVQTLYPKAHPSLKEYLSKTMTDRYASMLFTQHRGSTLKSRSPELSFNPMPSIGEEAEATIPSGDPPDQGAGRALDSSGPVTAPVYVSQSDLSTVNSSILRQALSGPSNLGPAHEQRRGTSSVQVSQANYPRLPFREESNSFTCEFCTRAIDRENITEGDWR